MKNGHGWAWLLGCAALGLAAAGGYWQGQKTVSGSAPVAAAEARKLLYYRNPMGLPDTSPVPKKDSMGMDYLPVYAEDAPAIDTSAAARRVSLSAEKIQKLGVRTVRVTQGQIDRMIRASGRIEADERRIHVLAPRFEGYVERLWVNASGQAVRRGQPLFDVYAPELLSAQREYLLARQGMQATQAGDEHTQRGMQQLAEAALQRLRQWGVAEAQIKTLEKSATPQRTLTLRSPVSGVVTEKKAVAGQRFMPGDTLYQITDLSQVWLLADVPEQEMAHLRIGMKATLDFDAWPGKPRTGSVSYIYPTLNAATRSVPVRIELANPGFQLKPAMYARVTWQIGQDAQHAQHAQNEQPPSALVVPVSAIIDSGTRQVVLVQTGTATEGHFEPRDVTLGARGETMVAVLAGLHEGERVVVAAQFLIDAESNLRAALGGMTRGSVPASNPPSSAAEHVADAAHAEHARLEEADKPAHRVKDSAHDHAGH